jgi:UDP-N-acetylglucosamine 2-epimerase
VRRPFSNLGYQAEPGGAQFNAEAPCVLAVAGDPGGAAALAPVLVALQENCRVRVEARPYRQAQDVWRKWGFVCEALDETCSSRRISELLEDLQPSLLLCGTSVNGVDLEKSFIEAARGCGIPSLSMLDFWSNYAARFSDHRGNLMFLPDLIAVMDSPAREQMIAEGFPSARLCVTGQPAFDCLEARRRGFSAARRGALRANLGAETDDHLVVFVSQPLAVMYGPNSSCAHNHPGYNEHEVLQRVVSALETISEETSAKIILAVRPHPRERSESFLAHASPRIQIKLACEENAHELVISADLVAGMTSALLVEACYLGCVTLSLQPGLRTADVLPTNALGVSRAVYRQGDVLPALREVMLNPVVREAMRQRLTSFQTDGRATQRVLDRVLEMMNRSVAAIQS